MAKVSVVLGLFLVLVFLASCATEKSIIDCGTAESSNQCFVDAAKECTPAKIILDTNIEMMGIVISGQSYKEIKGLEDDRCVVFERIDEYSVDYTDETIQEMLNQGITQEEIDAGLEAQISEIDAMIGMNGTCKYTIDLLVKNLENAMQGSFEISLADAQNYECTGPLYE